MPRRFYLIAAVTATVLAAAGCNTSGGTGAGTGTGTSGPAASKQAADVTIGFAQREVDAPYYSAMVQEAKAVAKDKGVKLLVQNAASDPVTQVNQINTMVSQGVDLIVVNAVSPQTEKAQLTQVAGKVPLMFIDTAIPDVGFTAVQSDNAAIGSDAGELMAKRVGSGKTLKLAILNGGPTDEIVGPQRQKGFLAGLKKGGVTVDIVAPPPGSTPATRPSRRWRTCSARTRTSRRCSV